MYDGIDCLIAHPDESLIVCGREAGRTILRCYGLRNGGEIERAEITGTVDCAAHILLSKKRCLAFSNRLVFFAFSVLAFLILRLCWYFALNLGEFC